MIEIAAINEIVGQYEKHGWKLRRALLSKDWALLAPRFDPSIDVIESDLEALWFSRKSHPESEAWELRRLTGSPFALIAVVATDASDEDREAALRGVEDDMRERTTA